MMTYENHNIIIKPSSLHIGPGASRILDFNAVTKGELDEDYQKFLNHPRLESRGINDQEAPKAKLQATNRKNCSDPNLRRNYVQAQQRVFDFNSSIMQGGSIAPEGHITQEENINQDQSLGGKLGWLGKMTPIMNKSLMRAVVFCGNEDDFLETSDRESNVLPRGDLDEDYNNFINDADLEFGGLSDPKARDAKLEQPRKFSLSGPGLRYTSVNPHI
ncbi:uncharacterized protein MELLADRAFT_71906 [Melampsora larici-populina 98AG31]|uniref:Uncharacterized protein n=1 Tax=Melampsora larici-populina (strain 98AG31 / pathotype 3-4-7) TaxID=747676 RepID=F4RM74_MELLP|nr:uncharacterized protein MELLADRAFT_71906 [Melampsora larici-populina 98AG31]EGG06372.1 hypothetical protein MELLADRAFT_71906 [Melampsora larici-populina 98AG31]